ncbi:MAG TPA: glycoside hydrolase family 16 protein [Bacteroidetes bacterium]|nr:glycoside hydrolase family 16 protein [Bacteroidota bacterium]
MRKTLFFLCLLFLLIPKAGGQSPRFLNRGWELTWYDDFEGNSLDTSRWSMAVGRRRFGIWTSDAVKVSDGILTIRIFRWQGQYFSGAVLSRGKFESRYGYWEIRCRLPREEGHWPAFWIQNDGMEGNAGTDDPGAEIDIMEYHARWGDTLLHAVHWGGYGENMRSAEEKVKIPGLSEGFHTFGLRWTPLSYRFYVDGKRTWTLRKGVSRQSQYVIISEEIGRWAGEIEKTELPDRFEVDYIRVYHR